MEKCLLLHCRNAFENLPPGEGFIYFIYSHIGWKITVPRLELFSPPANNYVIADIWLLAFGAVIQAGLAQEKWVWGSRDNKQGFARDDGKGRYGVYEPEAPDEPYRPGVRPPPANLPPLIRPSGRPPPSHISNLDNNRPLSFPNSNNNYNSGINNNRPSRPDNYNNRRPTGDHLIPSYPGRPPVAARPPPASPPPLPPFPPKTLQHRPDNKDPTNFEKCKCAYSFNCKSPAILFGTCDAGKKYCCEKFSASRPRGPIDNDQGDPLVLVGPGGPFDPVFKDQRNYDRGTSSFGRRP